MMYGASALQEGCSTLGANRSNRMIGHTLGRPSPAVDVDVVIVILIDGGGGGCFESPFNTLVLGLNWMNKHGPNATGVHSNAHVGLGASCDASSSASVCPLLASQQCSG